MSAYNHLEIEKKWQQFWEENKTFSVGAYCNTPLPNHCNTPLPTNNTKKFYALDMFPFPSGAGLHVGHPEGYTATDIICRKKRMEGFEVLHPMGWDAFGLPAENFAIKTGVHPKISTDNNIKNFTRQIKSLGFSYDWNREFSTTDEEYYKWTQWIFLKLYEKGLLYEDEKPLNWCPSCKVVCANEEVEQGLHERCGNAVTKKSLKQWMFKITQYAQRLLDDLEDPMLDWPEKIKAMQRNWIGRSEGGEISFHIKNPKKNKTALILHGWEDVGDPIYRHWQPWLKKKLEEQGYEVFMPDFPHPDKPNLSEYLEVLEPFREKMNENSVVVGHSMGGFIAAHFVQNLENPIDMLVSVAPVYNGWGKKEASDHPFFAEVLEKTLSFHYDAEKVKSRVGKWKGIFSSNDGIPLAEVSAHFDAMELEYKIIENAGHFCERDGYVEFPELFYEICPKISVYTTRADTIFSGTFLILSPENPLVEQLTTPEQKNEIEKYQKKCAAMSDLDRTELNKEKTGAFTGSYAINPANGDEMPIWISDFVLASYGTGAVFADAHDERDFEMAKIYGIPLKTSIYPENASDEEKQKICNLEKCFSDKGILINSGEFDGMKSDEAIPKILDWLAEKGCATKKINYRLRDWIFTRQRYWGEPIPLVFDENGKCYPLDESELPLVLPESANYEPSESGESPLAKIENWVNVKGYVTEKGTVKTVKEGDPHPSPLPEGEGIIQNFRRETSTMPNWAGSSWYYLRFMDAKNPEKAWSQESENFWGPVDLYVGGAEHAVLHLLYARFWHKALYDLGLVSTKEPFKKLVNQGLILSYAYQRSGGGLVPMDEVEEKMVDGEPKYFEKSTKEEVKKIVAKMSKSLKNVVNPDEIIEAFGADTLRMYEMFMGPFEQSKAWDTSAVEGMHKFLARIYRNFTEKEIVDVCPPENLVRLTHQTVKKVSDDIDSFKFNTAISQLMIWMNEFSKLDHIPRIAGGRFVRLLAPFAPHLAEELWQKFSPEDETISFVKWPSYDEKFLVSDSVVYAVQVNGKLRADFEMPKDATKEEVLLEAKKLEKVQKYLSEGEIRKEIFVPGKIVGFVVN